MMIILPVAAARKAHLDGTTLPLLETFTLGVSLQQTLELVGAKELHGVRSRVRRHAQIMNFHLKLQTANTNMHSLKHYSLDVISYRCNHTVFNHFFD